MEELEVGGKENGSNDMTDVIWALGEFFFIFLGASLCFTVNTHCNMPITHHGGVGSQW